MCLCVLRSCGGEVTQRIRKSDNILLYFSIIHSQKNYCGLKIATNVWYYFIHCQYCLTNSSHVLYSLLLYEGETRNISLIQLSFLIANSYHTNYGNTLCLCNFKKNVLLSNIYESQKSAVYVVLNSYTQSCTFVPVLISFVQLKQDSHSASAKSVNTHCTLIS